MEQSICRQLNSCYYNNKVSWFMVTLQPHLYIYLKLCSFLYLYSFGITIIVIFWTITGAMLQHVLLGFGLVFFEFRKICYHFCTESVGYE